MVDPTPVSRRQKLPARYATVVMPFVLTIMMTFVVSGISTVRLTGLSPGFLTAWMASWGLSWLIAFPTLLAIFPLVRRIVAFVVEAPQRG